MKRIHPSATLFAAVLLAFTLPFGYSAQACGATTETYRGIDLLRGHVESSDPAYAKEVTRSGVPSSWLLFASAMTGLLLAVLKRGNLWATVCTVTAVAALFLAVAVELEPDVGWLIAFFVPVAGIGIKVVAALVRAIDRRRRDIVMRRRTTGRTFVLREGRAP